MDNEMSDTPITDIPLVERLRFQKRYTRGVVPVTMDEAAGRIEQLERENAELADQVMRWFKAASPYATPGSLEEGLKKLEASACPTPKGCSLFGCKDAAPQAEQIGDVKGPRNEGSPADAAAAWMCSRYNCQLAGRCCHRGSCEVGE
jgi:hypothetical protein